jgi:hypothetical protein
MWNKHALCGGFGIWMFRCLINAPQYLPCRAWLVCVAYAESAWLMLHEHASLPYCSTCELLQLAGWIVGRGC